ncbi:patatin family protein [Candidatus Ventrimonas sp. KK005]|nr:patatin family protein [Lachnospiraceae bacterium]NBH17255.1 patatin family protein [Clostridiaceae bacterium]
MERKEKTGLVLEGGGMRGIYTAGVLDVFLEKGIAFDGVIGVSAGVVHGCSYLSGQKGRSIRYYKRYCRDWRFMSFLNFLLTGNMVGEKFCYHDLPDRLEPYDYEAFKRSKTAFYATCSNVETGRPEYLQMTDMKAHVDIMRASASLPCISRIVRIHGMKLLDGACTDSVPVRAFRRMGYEKNVVVLTRQEGYVKKPEKNPMVRMRYFRYPRFVKAVEQRHLNYNKTVRYIHRLEKAGEVFVLRPSRELTIGRMEHDPKKLQWTYDLGRQDALDRLFQLENWLKEAKRLSL